MNFHLKMHFISQINIDALTATIQSMPSYVMSVWFIKQTMLDSKWIYHESVHMHKVIQTHRYKLSGFYLKLHTATIESSHKK